MKTLKVIEILANSNTSWEDAAKNAVAEAAKTLNGVKSVYIKDHSAIVEGNRIVEYRITAKITFELQNK